MCECRRVKPDMTGEKWRRQCDPGRDDPSRAPGACAAPGAAATVRSQEDDEDHHCYGPDREAGEDVIDRYASGRLLQLFGHGPVLLWRPGRGRRRPLAPGLPEHMERAA